MERAGAGVAKAVQEIAQEGPVAVVCGPGNNGGDGLVCARLLREAGREVRVVCVATPREFKGDALANLERLPEPGPVRLDGREWDGEARGAGGGDPLAGAVVIVDALLGTGFQGEPRGAVAEAIEAIEAVRTAVVSVDVPSGVDASSGVVAGAAVTATMTVTMHAAKPGLWIRPGKAHAGEVRRLGIGVPRGAPMQASVGLIGASVLEQLPRREPTGTKFASGHVVVVGGSLGLTGAPAMTARASMRTGAGYVTACVPASLQSVLASGGTPELMTVGLPDRDGTLTVEAVSRALDAIGRGGALALGPGLGRSEGAVAFARRLAHDATIAMVLDADGLNAHAGALRNLAGRRAMTVLTPHAGELGRLLERDSSQIEQARLESVREAAARSSSVVVLKGDDTLIASAEGMVAVSPGGEPGTRNGGHGRRAHGRDRSAAGAAGGAVHGGRRGRVAARGGGPARGGHDGRIGGRDRDGRDRGAAPRALGGRALLAGERRGGSTRLTAWLSPAHSARARAKAETRGACRRA